MAITWVLAVILDWKFYLILFALYLAYFYINIFVSGLPPGPTPFPIVGNIPQLGAQVHLSLPELGKRYTDVFTIHIFNKPMVILNSYKAIREAFIQHANSTSARSLDFYLRLINPERKGIVLTDGPLWREQRQFTLKVLHDLGMGKPFLEQKIQEEAAILVSTIRAENGQPIDPDRHLMLATANAICCLLFGHRFLYDDAKFIEAIQALVEMLECSKSCAPLNAMPWLQYLPGDLFAVQRTKITHRKYNKWIMEQIHAKDKEYGSQVHLDDFVSRYRHQQRKLESDGGTSTFTDIQLLRTLTDFCAGATDTSKTTLQWALLYLVHHPDFLLKVHREIDDVIGPHRPPCSRDRQHMPYTEAVITEVLRIRTLLPLALPHATTENIQVCGQWIPKGTTMLSNQYNINHDPGYWEQPEKFNPERFLGTGGKANAERVVAFGLGPRVCAGEALARMEMFLFLTTLLQSFTIEPPEGQQPPSTDGILGLFLCPLPYKLVFQERG